MLIHQLQITNFKSYNGDHTLGPFDHHFNCVIGPNGNGKSNIIDAVLFVFGFKSSKLRQDNLSSLIHRSAFAQPDKATVRVVFAEEDEKFSVSRTVTKSGNTYYKMNDEKINWNELREKLVSKKIDLNKNLFIILQGEVERLCELSPLTMVDYLEYISGSDEFKEPIEVAEKKYIDLSVVKEEKRMSLNVKRKLFESIREKAEELAVRVYLNLRINMLNHLVMKKTIYENSKNLEHLQQELAAKNQMIRQIETQVDAIDGAIEEKKAEVKEIQREMGKIQREIQKVENEAEKLANEISSLKREINFLSSDRDKKAQQLKRYEVQQQELSELSQKQKDFITRIKAIKEFINKQKQLPKLKICEEIQTKMLALKEAENNLANKNAQKRATLNESRQKLAIFNQKSKEFTGLKQTMIAKQKQIKGALIENEQKLKETQQTIQQLQRQLRNKPNEKMQGLTHKQKIISEIRSANRLKLLCPELILKTLRELVVIQPVYVEVVQTLLPHLDYFIVDNVKQAKEVSEYLNKKQIGRMTFLIKELINQTVKDITILQKAPNQTKLMLQLISCSNQDAKNILLWALGNTLITSSLDVAMKVAYYDQKKYRVITTNGEFIDSSGTITKLTLKASEFKQDTQMLTKKLETLQRLELSLQKRREELIIEQTEGTAKVAEIEQQQRNFDGLDSLILDELEKEIEKDQRLIERNRAQAEILSQNLEEVKSKLRQSRFKMNDYDKVVAMLRQVAENEEKIKKIENTATILANLAAKRAQIQLQMADCSKKIEAKVKAKVSVQTEKQKLANEVSLKKTMIEHITASRQTIEQQRCDLQAERQKHINKLTDKQGAARPLRDQAAKLKSAIKSVEYSQIQIKNKMMESLKVIKEFAGIAFNSIYQKYPELVPKTSDKTAAQTAQNGLQSMFRESLTIPLAKQDINYLETLSQSEREFLLESSNRAQSLYRKEDDFLPESPQFDMFLLAVELKEFRFSHSFEEEKLRHFEKDRKVQNSQHYDFELLDEYRDAKQECDLLGRNLEQIENNLSTVKQELISLRNQRLSIFMTNFNEINFQLNNIYTRLTGGKAELNFLDSMNPFEGVEFAVRPVNKSWKRVNLLSGGQKTFTSLALIFACEQIKKFPFYFMDEIDAALDYKNTSLLAQYIKQKTSTQHIVISLRKNMYQECNRIVGIYKVKDQSRTIETSMKDLLTKSQQ